MMVAKGQDRTNAPQQSAPEQTAKISANRVLFSHHYDSGERTCKCPSYAGNLNTKQTQ
jgi:hypothetical protein